MKIYRLFDVLVESGGTEKYDGIWKFWINKMNANERNERNSVSVTLEENSIRFPT